MKKVITKKKINVCFDVKVMEHLNTIENKSKYVEHLIYKDLKDKELLKKEIIL